jgi:hypothetical protein
MPSDRSEFCLRVLLCLAALLAAALVLCQLGR